MDSSSLARGCQVTSKGKKEHLGKQTWKYHAQPAQAGTISSSVIHQTVFVVPHGE
jgi:hypothetical protein